MRRAGKYTETIMNNFQIRKKLLILYLFCMILPLVITDGVILTLLIREENIETRHQMQSMADSISYELSAVFETADRLTNSIYTNRELNELLDKNFETNLDFYTESKALMKSVNYDMVIGYSNAQLVMYADNDTIVNGGNFRQLKSVEHLSWYQDFCDTGKDSDLYFYYDDSGTMTFYNQRMVSVIRRLNYFHNDAGEKLVKLDLDYNNVIQKLINMNYGAPVYVCSGDWILFSNESDNNYSEDFPKLTGAENIGYEKEWSFYDKKLRILIAEPENTILSWLTQNISFILLLTAVNILLPWIIMKAINRSFVERLQTLSSAFDAVELEALEPIGPIQGTDEIAGLMKNYNRMLGRLQELIQIVYKDRLERQEIDIARQKAELLALHSQINPHFLFNVLESIRMHSVLKGEKETAEMIARLALLERQSVKWTSDLATVQEEVQFSEAYLELQKYRFGNRLSYELQVMPQCREYPIPRLSLSTFVENACVHGMEGKTGNCWIYIRIYEKEGWLYIEVEDTGRGMTEEMTQELLKQMRGCDINTIRESEHVGILNACLRLKMISDGMAEFTIESEEGAGSWFMIRIPVKKIHKKAAGGSTVSPSLLFHV